MKGSGIGNYCRKGSKMGKKPEQTSVIVSGKLILQNAVGKKLSV